MHLINFFLQKLAIDGFRSLINCINEEEEGSVGVSNDVLEVLIDCLKSSDELLRQTGLRGIEIVTNKIMESTHSSSPLLYSFKGSLLVTCNDTNNDNNTLANR